MLTALLGAAGSLFGANAQRKASSAYARSIASIGDMLRQYGEPFLEQARFGMKGLRGLIGQGMSRLGKESAILRGQHEENLTGIGRQAQKSLGDVRGYWKAAGNLGRARGEELAIERSQQEATNRENLGYGGLQQDYRDRMLADLQNAYGNLTQFGMRGFEPITAGARLGVEGAGAKFQGQSDFWSDIGALGGTAIGYGLDRYANRVSPLVTTGQATVSNPAVTAKNSTAIGAPLAGRPFGLYEQEPLDMFGRPIKRRLSFS